MGSTSDAVARPSESGAMTSTSASSHDDTVDVAVSRAAVKCAAQLYYTMVLGDELDVFGAVNFFTHRYLLRGGIEITDDRLRDDLQDYVFSNQFSRT